MENIGEQNESIGEPTIEINEFLPLTIEKKRGKKEKHRALLN